MKIKLGAKQHRLLCEAMRRAICFSVRSDKIDIKEIEKGDICIGYPSYYKTVVKAGYMVPFRRKQPARCPGWYRFTPLGATIVRKWIKDGYGPRQGEYENAGIPPMTVELTELATELRPTGVHEVLKSMS